jgi:hypothetical protein
MSRLFPFVIGVLFASLLGLTSAFHVSPESGNMSLVAASSLALSMASVSKPASVELPGDATGRLPHAHIECHGDHLILPFKAIISQLKLEHAYSTLGRRISEGVTPAQTLRPPKLEPAETIEAACTWSMVTLAGGFATPLALKLASALVV